VLFNYEDEEGTRGALGLVGVLLGLGILHCEPRVAATGAHLGLHLDLKCRQIGTDQRRLNQRRADLHAHRLPSPSGLRRHYSMRPRSLPLVASSLPSSTSLVLPIYIPNKVAALHVAASPNLGKRIRWEEIDGVR